MTTRILLVDDHAVVRNGLRTVLSTNRRLSVEGEAETARDVVIFDVSLPDMTGIEAMKLILNEKPKQAIVIFSMHADREYCVRALRAGALGYVTKQGAPEEIIKAVETVSVGRRYVSPAIAEHLVGAVLSAGDDRPPHETLSDREFEVLRLIGTGETASQIAQRLCLSVKTVSTYRARLLEKLGLENNSQLIRYVVDHGLDR
jgi:DNA-binding NarL/FixJ family response regulator